MLINCSPILFGKGSGSGVWDREPGTGTGLNYTKGCVSYLRKGQRSEESLNFAPYSAHGSSR